MMMQEKKRNNELRHCKWCGKYKPDRTHHYRVYGTCILKMDHLAQELSHIDLRFASESDSKSLFCGLDLRFVPCFHVQFGIL